MVLVKQPPHLAHLLLWPSAGSYQL